MMSEMAALFVDILPQSIYLYESLEVQMCVGLNQQRAMRGPMWGEGLGFSRFFFGSFTHKSVNSQRCS